MKKVRVIKLFCSFTALLPLLSFCQSNPYFQQKADFVIDVSLNAEEKTLDGFVSLNYTNNSPDTLRFIWFHLWPNAYKNDRTAFSEQMLKLGKTDFYFSDEGKRGYINKLNFSVEGVSATLEDHPLYIDVARLILPTPLSPGQTIHIQTPFHEKIPYLFSRGGFIDDFFMITQWYPKPAVYDRNGWHPMPYLDQGEYYSEFGSYEVNITLPAEFVLAATGKQTNTQTSGKLKTVTYLQDNVHDFAWFAGKDLVSDSTEIQSSNGHTIQLFSYYRNESKELWKESLRYSEEIVRKMEHNVGAYPYETLSVLEAPKGFGGGMEYPTITSIQQVEDSQTLKDILYHEVIHNWFYGILATNERDYPWMDEGMTSFYSERAFNIETNSPSVEKKNFLEKRIPEDFGSLVHHYLVSEKLDQPSNLTSAEYSPQNYYASIYYKGAAWMQRLKNYLGEDAFRKSMRAYYEEWKFKHPSPEDFKETVNRIGGKNIDSLFNLLYENGNLIPAESKQLRFRTFFDLNKTDQYNYLSMAPVLGFNQYDGLMAGLFLHNYTLPEPPLHFFAAPMIGTKSKKLTGIGRIGYSHTSYGAIRKLEVFAGLSHFNMREFTDSTGTKNFMYFTKVAPGIRLTFKNKSPLSKSEKYLQWKTNLITETSLNFRRDTIWDLDIITYPKSSRYLNELIFANENIRELYPFSYKAMIHQGDGFIRLGIEHQQFFNYSKKGGLNARIFGGKLLYTNNNLPRYLYRRYQFNMTGANGYEDYTYSNYFIGRNQFEGTASQQIMVRDGGFKVRTDLLNNKVGTSDNWLAALNLTTDIPDKINPLSILSKIFTLKAFMDIGTYSDGWDKNAETGKFLFDAGLQINLGTDLVKIYFPILYSKVYGDYFKSTIPEKGRFWKTVSFSIDIQQIKFRKLLNSVN